MNIFYTYDIFSVQRYGGISRYYYELMKRMPSFEPNVHVLAGLYINEYISDKKIKKIGVKVKALRLNSQIRRTINSMFQTYILSRANFRDIIHQTYFYKFTPPANARHIITVYDMIDERFPEHFSRWNRASELKEISCKKADKIIAISHSTKNDLVELFNIAPEKIDVVHLASSLNSSEYDNNKPLFQQPYILYVGKRGGYKNFKNLLSAYSKSNRIKHDFHMVCFGGQPFTKEEKNEFFKLRIHNQIHYISGNDSLLRNCYQNATAFICPSIYEGFGLTLLEAMGLSCPVICANTSSIPEVVGEAGIYFDPNNIASLQSAMKETLFNEDLLKGLKKKGRERESKFSWDKCASETFKVYKSLII